MRTTKRSRRRQTHERRPTLRFSPYAWAKLLYLRDRGETEIGGFGITGLQDPLLIEQFQLVRQHATPLTVGFDDSAVAEYFDEQVDRGLRPEQFARIWIHTHPGHSPLPSRTDEETFERVFGRCDWAVMFILARGGASYARLRFRSGPGAELRFASEVDYRASFAGSDTTAWDAEYAANVVPLHLLVWDSLAAAQLPLSFDPYDEWLDPSIARPFSVSEFLFT